MLIGEKSNFRCYGSEIKTLIKSGLSKAYIRANLDKLLMSSSSFPSWDEYSELFDGDEYDCIMSFWAVYEQRKAAWDEK